jgi:hypothetical protein
MAVIAGTPSSPGVNRGGSLKAKIVVGTHMMTNSFVPVWLLGKCDTPEAECHPDVGAVGPAATGSYYGAWTWILPKPLYVLPSMPIAIQVQRAGPLGGLPGDAFAIDSPGTTLPIWISVTGGYIERGFKAPSVIDVPYVTAMVGSATVVGQAVTPLPINYSQKSDLENPFSRPLEIERLTGRLRNFNPLSAFPGAVEFDYLLPNPTIFMRDSLGYGLTRDYVPFNEVFDVSRRDWCIRRSIPSREYYSAIVNSNGVANLYPQVAIVGSRKEEI